MQQVFCILMWYSAATPVIRTINDTNILSKRYWAYAAFGR